MKKPRTKPVRKYTNEANGVVYHLLRRGNALELWVAGRHGFFCGYVSCVEGMECAIDNHEEEMFSLLQDFR